jgi:c-di-GMP-binding flagellar brake protein YcgR
MSAEADVRRPAPGSVVELFFASRSDPLLTWCEGLPDDDVVVCAPLDLSRRPVTLDIGEHLEVVWKHDGELRALPVVLVATELGERPAWRLSEAGVLRRGQRRDAVRAPMHIPVRIGPDIGPLTGTTVDMSEGGLRCVLDRARDLAQEPSTGDVVRITALFPDATVTCLAEVTRRHERDDPRLEVSLRFIGLTENHQDVVRRRVFARLRELRNRGLL